MIGDFIFQTDAQAANKMKPGTSGWVSDAEHVTTYTLALSFATYPALYLGDVTFYKLLLLLGVSALTHAFIDRRWPVRWLMEHTGSKEFAKTVWGPIVTDQVLHLSILLVLVATLGAR
jgi:hypothetical protein